ncbi:MAG: alpha/beta fold hydrolase [Hyphomicrobiales bacterium]|nr:alpha/beta fold hydrolase [Hyphomicrobiales bacterium]
MAETKRARVNGIELAYRLEGAEGAPAVVLHHPLATNLSFWDEAASALAPRYRVLRLDARGHGVSEAPKGPYTFETLAGDVTGLMDACGIPKAAFVGLSMGGMVGQYLGLQHAARFSCLVLASTTSRIPPEARSLWVDRVVVARASGMASQVEPAMARWLSAQNRGRPELVARCRQMIEGTPIDGYAGWCGAIERLDMTDRLGAITLPTLVIVGADDPATPVAASQVIHDRIPGSSLAVIPGVSHMLAIEDPAAFHAALLPFLDRHAAR